MAKNWDHNCHGIHAAVNDFTGERLFSTGRQLRRDGEGRRRREAKQLQQLMQVRMGLTD